MRVLDVRKASFRCCIRGWPCDTTSIHHQGRHGSRTQSRSTQSSLVNYMCVCCYCFSSIDLDNITYITDIYYIHVSYATLVDWFCWELLGSLITVESPKTILFCEESCLLLHSPPCFVLCLQCSNPHSCMRAEHGIAWDGEDEKILCSLWQD